MHRLLLAIWFLTAASAGASEAIHLFVALADNASQGIAPVPAKIGNGDDPAGNLYWGCDEGVRTWFSKSRNWKKLKAPVAPRAEILERLVFKHARKDIYLIADAWRGKEIKSCLQTFISAAAGQSHEELVLPDGKLKLGGEAALIAYIGHNGLMDFRLEWTVKPEADPVLPAIVLCCKSDDYFSANLKAAGARPILTTTQFMYPGAFILHDALEVWLAGGKPETMREAAGRAYAKNQGISVRSGTGVFR